MCDDGSDPSAISLEPGETVTCTYTFVKRGHVLVDVTTNPAGDAQVFDFSLSGGPADASLDQAFGLADATAPHDSGPAKAGTYAVSALYAEADWDLVGAACSDGSIPSAVAVEPGETVTCTFDYVKRGHILVDVVTDPAGDPQLFDFGLGGGPADAPIDQAFSLADTHDAPRQRRHQARDLPAASSAPPDAEWDLAGAACATTRALRGPCSSTRRDGHLHLHLRQAGPHPRRCGHRPERRLAVLRLRPRRRTGGGDRRSELQP